MDAHQKSRSLSLACLSRFPATQCLTIALTPDTEDCSRVKELQASGFALVTNSAATFLHDKPALRKEL